jgi:pimeloyl-ACP methyl ester carboxylesterase
MMSGAPDYPLQVRSERLAAAGVRLLLHRAGSGPPIVLLHGFPEHARSWQLQIPALVAAGFEVFAPDQRGYGGSDRPHRRDAYRLELLVADVAAIVAATGAPRAHIVGHDWGGVIAWTFAAVHPELTARLAILNAPHPAVYRRSLWRSAQLVKSWYAFLFLVPGLAERVLSAADFAAVRWMLTHGGGRGVRRSKGDIDETLVPLRRPGSLTAALNYYRANARPPRFPPPGLRIAAETLVIWGDHDPALSNRLLEGLSAQVRHLRVERLRGVGHWVQYEQPEIVNRLLVEFFRNGASGRPAREGPDEAPFAPRAHATEPRDG